MPNNAHFPRAPKTLKYSIFSLARNAASHHERWPLAWRSPQPKKRYDAVIIGGGGHGLATAYYLAKNHGHDQHRRAGEGLARRRQHRAQHDHRPLELPPGCQRAVLRAVAEALGRAVAGTQFQCDVQRARRAEPGAFAGRHGRGDAPRQRDAAERHRRRVSVARQDRAADTRTSTARATRASPSSAACCSRAAVPCGTTRSPGGTRGRRTRCGVDIIQQCEVTGIRIDAGAITGCRDDARRHRHAPGWASPSPAIRGRSRRWPDCGCRSSRTCCRRWCPSRSSRCSIPW